MQTVNLFSTVALQRDTDTHSLHCKLKLGPGPEDLQAEKVQDTQDNVSLYGNVPRSGIAGLCAIGRGSSKETLRMPYIFTDGRQRLVR